VTRARLLVVLSSIAVLVVGAVALFALWGDGPTRKGFTTVNVGDLHRGDVESLTVTFPDQSKPKPPKYARIFLVRQTRRRVDAFLGVSTHLGCRLLVPGDRRYGNVVTPSDASVFEDPCGGSAFALNGDCVGGPCPRGLDRYPVEVHDDIAEIDLNHLVTGPKRGS
jgi:Rieske Fe-S protein